ncbi:MAG: hypothetical protein Fur0018_18240 [Anaerolineales bacterium]
MANQERYTLGVDDEIFPLMVYSATYVAWGDAITKKTIRFLKLLRTPMCPAYIVLYDARLLPTGASRPLTFPVLHISIADVLVVHPTPPAQEPYDYSQAEENRKMEPMTTVMGAFRLDGKMRISTRTNITQVLDAAKEPYLPVYDATITSLGAGENKPLRTQMAVVRRTNTLIAAYSTAAESGL